MLLIHFSSQGECRITNQSSYYCPQELAKATDEKHLQSPFPTLNIRLPALPLKKSKLLTPKETCITPTICSHGNKSFQWRCALKAEDAIFAYQLLLMPILFHRSMLTLESKPLEGFPTHLCKPATTGQQWRRPSSTLALQSCPRLTQACRVEKKVITLGISGFNSPGSLLEFY